MIDTETDLVMKIQNIIKINSEVDDCLICAIRPLILTGITMPYIAKPECPHRNNVFEPKFKLTKLHTLFSTVWISILVLFVVSILVNLLEYPQMPVGMKLNYIFIMPNFMNTICFSVSMIFYNETFNLYTNGLMYLLYEHNILGMNPILHGSKLVFLKVFSLVSAYANCGFGIVTFFGVLSQLEDYTFGAILMAASLLVDIVNAMNYSTFFITVLPVYEFTLKACLNTMEKTLHTKITSMESLNGEFLKELQTLQRFYLALVRNYRHHVFAFGNAWLFFIQMCFLIFSIVEVYVHVTHVLTIEPSWAWMTNFRMIFSLYINVYIYVYYWLTKRILIMVSVQTGLVEYLGISGESL
ncbi:hypothetical protein JTB14_037438 [Gonioctena quinquepunctata]|nr:hypothetical protein JTB14_037438 [Gonioctena quinquepunctata]